MIEKAPHRYTQKLYIMPLELWMLSFTFAFYFTFCVKWIASATVQNYQLKLNQTNVPCDRW